MDIFGKKEIARLKKEWHLEREKYIETINELKLKLESATKIQNKEIQISENEKNGETKIFIQRNRLPNNFILTDDFKIAFDLIENTKQSIFLTGKAGTGKSTFIDYLRMETKKKIICLAPTGVAALNIGAKTIHSFFQFPPVVITSNIIENVKYKEKTIEIFKKVETIVLDEISMVRADLLEGINYILQKHRNLELPFGGVQLLFIGDMYQLPPVVDNKKVVQIRHPDNFVFTGTLYDYFEWMYGGPYFFNSRTFKKAQVNYYELKEIFRQKEDASFIGILNQIREKNISTQLLHKLNERCNRDISPKSMAEKSIYLASTNATVKEINESMLKMLKSNEFKYDAVLTGKFESEYSEDDYPAEKVLRLKQGSQVMLTKNDPNGNWVNGTIAIIKELDKNQIVVEINRTPFTINQETWETYEYVFNVETEMLEQNVVGTFSQYPIKLAWAITIHKSQGKTFENVIIDLGNKAFAHGQTYVALSRCTKLNGIILKRPIAPQDILVDDKVIHFIKEMNQRIENKWAINF